MAAADGETPDQDGGSPAAAFPAGAVLLVDGTSTVQCRGETATVDPAAGSLELRAVGATDLGLVDGACTYRLARVAGGLEAPLPQHCDDGLSHFDLKKATVSPLDQHRFHLVYDVVSTTDDDAVASPCEVSTDATVRPAAPDDLCSPLGTWSASLATPPSPATQPAAPSLTIAVSDDSWVVRSDDGTITSRWTKTAEGLSLTDVGSIPAGAACPMNQVGSYRQLFVDDCSIFELEAQLDRCDSRSTALSYARFSRQ